MGSEMQGIEVRGHVIKGGEVGSVDGTTFGAGTGYVRAMGYLHFRNRSRRYVIASSWALQLTEGASVLCTCKDVNGMDDVEFWGERRL